jgi:DNA-binding CsgD family transcriptional regulator
MRTISTLTPAEETVYKLVGLGLSNDELAAELFISALTVRTHLKHIHAKLDIVGRPKLAVESYKAHWASPNRFAAAIEILKMRGRNQLHTEAITVLTRAGEGAVERAKHQAYLDSIGG